VLDLLGTFVFALSGAAAGVKNKLDLFGLMVLAFVGALLCLYLRLMAIFRGWHLPTARATAGDA